MIGWWFVVTTQRPQERDDPTPYKLRESTLAQWEVAVSGIDWIERLVKDGKAVQLKSGGYPSRYTAKAGVVLPLLKNGGVLPAKDGLWVFGVDAGEEYAQPPDWIDNVQVHAERVAACPPDLDLTIDVWDLS